MSVERVEIPADPSVFAEWMEAVPGDEGATRQELCDIWKCSQRMVSRHLKAAESAGMLKAGWRVITDVSGRRNRVPVYSFSEKPKGKSRSK